MGYADDIILLAPSRGAMEKMLNICEEFGFKNNLKFSTDVNPSKSKTKCMYMCGPNVKSPKYPVPLKLYGKDLPWVRHANHLGHEISEDGSMNLDTNIKRADFIRKSSELRDLFSFALPLQVLGAVTVYSCHFYGSMLWDLFGESAGKVYRSWNTCVKLVWNVPRNTHNYFVENLLAKSFYSVRAQILSQFISFVKRLRQSISHEVRLMCHISAADVRSQFGRNIDNLRLECDVDPWVAIPRNFKRNYRLYRTPDVDKWRVDLLDTLLIQRRDMDTMGEDTDMITGLIDSLCST